MEGRNADRWREEGRQEERARHREETKALVLTLPEMRALGAADERVRLRPLLERIATALDLLLDSMESGSLTPTLVHEQGAKALDDLRRELGKEGGE